MNVLAAENGLSYYVGMGEVMQAYTLITLVDFFGDIPYSEALSGSENLNPALDTVQSVSNAASAIMQLTLTTDILCIVLVIQILEQVYISQTGI